MALRKHGRELEARGELAAAEDAYRAALDGGDGSAGVWLGLLLERRGALAVAETAYGAADECAHAGGALALGLLESGSGAWTRQLAPTSVREPAAWSRATFTTEIYSRALAI